MWVAYLVAVVLIVRLRATAPAREPRCRSSSSARAVASVALILTPPMLSSDLYHYALFGRMIITRGLNPYVTPGDAAGRRSAVAARELARLFDPLRPGVHRAVRGGGVGRRGQPVGTALAFKTLATAFGALTVWAVAALARREARSGLLPCCSSPGTPSR